MTAPNQLAYLQHIRDALLAVQEFTQDGQAAFAASRLIRDAVLRNLEVVGEAAKQLDDETRNGAPGVPWHRIAGLRDVLIHHYFGVDLDAVWRVVEVEVPVLLAATEKLIQELEA